MTNEEIKRFKATIWLTRTSRIKAEKRLIEKENFVQGINIYYSCTTIIFSILSLIIENDTLSLMTVLMTISLLIVILYLNGQKYLNGANKYKNNYTELHKLEMRLNHVQECDNYEIKKIENEYCNLMNTGDNHSSYDYYCAVADNKSEYRCERWDKVKHKYRWGCLWRIIIKIVVILLPGVLGILSLVI